MSDFVKKKYGKEKKPYNKGKGYNKPKDKGTDIDVPIGKNDVSWYIGNEQLARDIASLPYNVLTGRPLDIMPLGPATVEASRKDGGQTSAPGIMRIGFATSVGNSVSSESAINTAARAMYSEIRQKNSGHTNYQNQDLIIYVMAMNEIYSSFLAAKRIYGLALTYKMTNRYIPKHVLSACNIDVDNISANLAQFRAGLNLAAQKISSMAVPTSFTTILRHDMLCSNIFLDSDTDRGQYIIFDKTHYRRYDATHPNGGALVTFQNSTTGSNGTRTYIDILDDINHMIELVIADDDMNIMSGDILKAYGETTMFRIAPVEDNYMCPPVFNTEVLGQVENAISYVGQGRAVNLASLDITQDPNTAIIIHKPLLELDAANGKGQRFHCSTHERFILNSHNANPDYKENIENSRLANPIAMGWTTDESIKYYFPIYCGSEVITSMELFQIQEADNSTFLFSVELATHFIIADFNDHNELEHYIRQSAMLLAFDWHPFVYVFIPYSSPNDKSWQRITPGGDLKVYTVYSIENIKRIHETVMLAMFRTQYLLK